MKTLSAGWDLSAVVQRTSTQTIPGSTDTPIQWDTETRDIGGFFVSTANTRLTAPVSGLYLVTIYVRFSGSGNCFVHLKVNDSFFYPTYSHLTAVERAINAGLIPMERADYVEAVVFTSNDNVDTAHMAIARVGNS